MQDVMYKLDREHTVSTFFIVSEQKFRGQENSL